MNRQTRYGLIGVGVGVPISVIGQTVTGATAVGAWAVIGAIAATSGFVALLVGFVLLAIGLIKSDPIRYGAAELLLTVVTGLVAVPFVVHTNDDNPPMIIYALAATLMTTAALGLLTSLVVLAGGLLRKRPA